MDINIFYEDNHIIVVDKPPKLPCQKDKTEDADLLSILQEKLSKEHNIKNPYIGLIHRLDRPVGGVILYAKTKFSTSNLSRQVQERSINKEYLAIICGNPEEKSGTLKDYLLKLKTINMSKVVNKDTKGSKEAILDYNIIETIETEEFGPLSLVRINLKTGRHHQIRVQLSHHKMPLWGDTKYNKTFTKRKEWNQIALWSHSLTFNHPKNNKELTFKSIPYNEYPWNLFNLSLLV